MMQMSCGIGILSASWTDSSRGEPMDFKVHRLAADATS